MSQDVGQASEKSTDEVIKHSGQVLEARLNVSDTLFEQTCPENLSPDGVPYLQPICCSSLAYPIPSRVGNEGAHPFR